MSESNPSRPLREIGVADHIWDALERMAQDMSVERDGLINQALFMFARLNGYLESNRVASPAVVQEHELDEPVAAPEPEPEADEPAEAHDAEPEHDHEHSSPPVEDEPNDATPRPAPMPAPRRSLSSLAQARAAKVEEPEEEEEAPPRRSESDELRRRTVEPPAAESFDPPANELDEDPDRKAVAERVLETAAELERLIKGKSQSNEQPEEASDEPQDDGAPAGEAEKALYVMAEDGELDKVAKERFLIGRGKHCDLIINSGKVSREHAAIVRDGTEYFIEDLGSSNGTWFNKQRIKRRKVEDGDEYFICSEKLKCVIR